VFKVVISFTIEIEVIWPRQTGLFEWIEMVISTQASIRTNSLLIARFCNPPQNVLNVGAFESLPDDVFDSWLKIRCELLLIEERLVVTAARLLYEMSDDRAFR
jgi:hypothetical protein